MSRKIDDPLRLMFRRKTEEMKLKRWDVSKYQRTPGDSHFLFVYDGDEVDKVLLYNTRETSPKEVCFDEVADYYEHIINRIPDAQNQLNKFWRISNEI